ncbi:MAG: SprT family zinc-dependent metalloprotease [Rhodovarius sp.]|nr:M48 family metallopeptidase [Rhodovarius sp.]MCX7931944.1 M48 family metallopeptidase [Rhodovarius sp.]MDW8313788.1 SprT family zinc-dependent metalloprotease [Rhodovarius sp.]
MDSPLTETILLTPRALLPPIACPVRWHRSARARRVSLRICPREGAVVVTLPPRAGRGAGMALLQRHAQWVAEQLRGMAPPARLAPGGEVPIGGCPHPIRHEPGRRGGAMIEEGQLVVTGQVEFLPRRVLDFLRAEAGRRLSAAALAHAERLGVRPRAIRIKDPRTRWGSCAPDGTLAFSWRLVMAPPWVLDYVAAHEVAHLREMNHSDRFWTLVEQLTPHREAATDWLRREGPRLLRVG